MTRSKLELKKLLAPAVPCPRAEKDVVQILALLRPPFIDELKKKYAAFEFFEWVRPLAGKLKKRLGALIDSDGNYFYIGE